MATSPRSTVGTFQPWTRSTFQLSRAQPRHKSWASSVERGVNSSVGTNNMLAKSCHKCRRKKVYKFSAMRNPGVSQDLIPIPNRDGGSTPPSYRDWVANFGSEVPALNRRELGANPRRPTISASVVKLLSSSASNGEFAGGSPAGCTSSRACGSTRIAEGPDSESGSLGGASPFMPTILRRLASAGIADPGDLKSPSLPGASPGSPTNLRSSNFGLASRRVVNRE